MRILLILVCLSVMAGAQSYERKASETDKPAVFGYMISDFFHPRYREGAAPVWRSAAFLWVLDALLLLELRRKRR